MSTVLLQYLTLTRQCVPRADLDRNNHVPTIVLGTFIRRIANKSDPHPGQFSSEGVSSTARQQSHHSFIDFHTPENLPKIVDSELSRADYFSYWN